MPEQDDTRLSLGSQTPLESRLEQLRELFPEAFTEGKLDLAKLRLALGESVATGPERYGLSWAGKAEAIRSVQIPSVGTLVPARDESVNFDTTENLFIEGDNLEVLKLLQKSYFGRIKMIYIDPPYNTGGDFIYPDNYAEPLSNYLALTGQAGADGLLTTNPETSGRFHSAWLNFIYPRLYLARNLLEEEGMIFVSIDDNELANLVLVLDEIFGEENRLAVVAWEKRFTRRGHCTKGSRLFPLISCAGFWHFCARLGVFDPGYLPEASDAGRARRRLGPFGPPPMPRPTGPPSSG